jgi:hypothetical protein
LKQCIDVLIVVAISLYRLLILLKQYIDVLIFVVRNEVTTTPLALLVMGESLYRKDLTLKNQFHEHELVTKGGPGGTL